MKPTAKLKAYKKYLKDNKKVDLMCPCGDKHEDLTLKLFEKLVLPYILEDRKEIFAEIEDYWTGSEKFLDITEEEMKKLKKKYGVE